MQIIDKACIILKLLANGESLTVAEIADTQNIPRPTTYRLLNSLAKNGLLEKDLKTKRYSLGLSLMRYANNINDMTAQKYMLEKVRPYMLETAHKTGETITLAASMGTRVVLIAIVEGVHSLRFYSEVGKEMPWNAAAPAKLFMAMQKDPLLRTRFLQSMDFSRYTDDTIMDIETYLEQLSQIQQSNIAYCINELDEFCMAISVPIFDAHNQMLLALTAVGYTSRMKDNHLDICQCLQESADKVSKLFRDSSALSI